MDSLKDTIIPKSDQLNADDLLTGAITVTVTDVKRGTTNEQPVFVHLDGGRQPYKPCKSMRRVLITAWGDNGKDWIGKRMTLYADGDVKFGGVKVGGIRISHLSDIADDMNMMLTATRGKRAEHRIKKLSAQSSPATSTAKPSGDLYYEQGIVTDVVHAETKNGVKYGITIAGVTAGTYDKQLADIAIELKHDGAIAKMSFNKDGNKNNLVTIEPANKEGVPQ